MLSRFFLLCNLFFLFHANAFADQCLDVFSAAQVANTNYSLVPLVTNGDKKVDEKSNYSMEISAGQNHDYDDIKADNNFTLTVTGMGTARLHLQGDLDLGNNANINADGAPQDLVIYIDGDLDIGNNATINALIWVSGDIKIDKNGTTTGSLSAKDDIELGSHTVVYDRNAVSKADFAGMCDNTPAARIITSYRFDELEYADTPNEIFDSIGGFHGQAKNSQPVAGKVCNAIDLSATGITDYAVLNENILTGKTDFSISLWAKTSKTSNQSFISGAGASNNELLMWFISATGFKPYLKNIDNGTVVTSNIADDNWHHIVWTRQGNQSCVFVDKVLQGCVTQSTASLNIQSLILGQEQDNIGGGFLSSQAFDGLIDELLVFDGAVSAADINTIYTNQNAGLDFNGDLRSCPSKPVPILNMRFDESSWSGAAGEIIDTAGNFNAQAKNGATTARTTPARIGNPGTCGYGVFDGVDDYVEIADNNALDLPNELTISTWIYPQSIPSSGLMAILSKDENYEFHVTPAGEINWWWSINQLSTSGAAIRANNWYHIAITYKDGQQRIYIDGEIMGSQAYTGQLPVNNDALQIGQDQSFSGRYFHGAIDEVQLYNQALTNAQVNELYLATHPCDSFVDHFEINMLDGQGLTCEADIIKLRVCSDASCSVLNPDAIDAVLTVEDSSGTSLTKNVTVVGGELDVQYLHPNAGAVSLSVNQAFECINGSPALCDVTFADTGFRFYATTAGTPIPEQLSGKPSDTGFLASTLHIQAIEKNDETGACQAALIDTPTIEMAATCVDPIACAGNQVAINNLTSTTNIATVNNSAALTYSPVALDFADDTQNSAAFALTYADAGKIQLHARYNIPDENGDPSDNYMLGSSNNFVVRPLGFYLNVVDNPKAQTATQINSVFKKAGNDFTTHLTAVQWQAVDDTNNDGVPDSGANLANNPPTINFGNEITPEKAIINDKLYLPAGGKEGDLVNDSFTNFVNGSATNNNMTYSEVGIVNFAANLTDNRYLGAGDVTGSEPYVGRFIPHHFELTIALDGELKSVCDITEPSSVMDFAYIGQLSKASSAKGALQYLLKPEVTITPQTKFNSHTENYTGDFTKLLLSGVKRFEIDDGTGTLVLAPVEDRVKLGADEVNKVKLKANLADGNLTEVAGVLSFQYSSADNFIYTHEQNAEVTPFTSIIHLSLASVIDEDGVIANDADGLGDTGIATDTVITLKPTGRQIRFGRAYLDNSFGPETSRLPQPFAVQYLNTAGKFVINTEDTCTNFNTDNITLTSGTLDESFTSVIAANGQFDDELPKGKTRAMLLEITGSGNQGTVNVEYDIYSWLKYDWNWDGVSAKEFTDNPSAIATFGMYRGNDRIIYQRERERSN